MSNKEYTKEYLKKNIEPLLVVGASIKIGKQYVEEIGGFEPGQIITLVLGDFEYDNGLYVQNQTTPAIWNEEADDFDSIYHLFGNDLENWYDCEIIKSNNPMTPQERIKAEAQKAVKVKNWGESLQIEMYIAGATAEHERAQPVIDAAEKIAKMFAHKGDHQPCAICQLTNALQQWKGEKEVGDG